jgi:UDP-GlcNAc:undecaprenyl-phosphate GlcNAc-1-phosphate transferase
VGFGISASAWIEVPWLGQAVSILWLLAVVNAYNMFDHADGMAATVGVVAFVALAAGQMLMGEWFVPGMALAAAGALAGFLLYNFPPAKLFMGDAGSHLIGYLFGALAMTARYYFPDRGTDFLVVLVPVAIFLVPLSDMFEVILYRLPKSPFVGDATSHLAHRMLARGARPATPVLWAAGLATVAGVLGNLLYFCGNVLLSMGLISVVGISGNLVLRRLRRRPKAEARA